MIGLVTLLVPCHPFWENWRKEFFRSPYYAPLLQFIAFKHIMIHQSDNLLLWNTSPKFHIVLFIFEKEDTTKHIQFGFFFWKYNLNVKDIFFLKKKGISVTKSLPYFFDFSLIFFLFDFFFTFLSFFFLKLILLISFFYNNLPFVHGLKYTT